MDIRPNPVFSECRKILVEWMTQVGDSFSLSRQTIYLAVALTDRIIDTEDIPKKQFQLVAISCILIAAKWKREKSMSLH